MKRFVLIAGVNGSGKTTLYTMISSLQEIESINLDVIVREIGDWRNPEDIIIAGRIVTRQRV